MLMEWYIQLAIIFVCWLILDLIWKKLKIKKLRVIDLLTPLILVALHFLSVQLMGLSVIPFIIFGLAVFGVLKTVLHAYLEGEILYSSFFLGFWRVVDLVALSSYIVLLIFQLCMLLNIV